MKYDWSIIIFMRERRSEDRKISASARFWWMESCQRISPRNCRTILITVKN